MPRYKNLQQDSYFHIGIYSLYDPATGGGKLHIISKITKPTPITREISFIEKINTSYKTIIFYTINQTHNINIILIHK